ncbi:hypothetical protein [Pseudomonas sp. MWU12-2323]|uniref:hypothetical protein n=1 Tax=Pseudomonas sp. MWU12-2323 TaxID=2651296 RepID=UPI00128D1608|nr:hypothetical protein [Pseudomonas sp. MWU12-2323]MPQ69293.1 hypothetical protein [Pseudomonas sp. MWU12-2323]
MSTRFSLGKPISIGGVEVVVVRDVVGVVHASKDSDTFSIVEPKGVDGRPAIYVSENDLTRLRDDYPGIKVYGLWQLMFYNNAVRLGAPLVTFPLTELGGLYLLMDGVSDNNDPASIATSGEYINKFIPDNVDVDIGKANVINVEMSSLMLPPQPAYTRLELSEKFKAENKRRWLVVASLCGLIAVSAVAANYGLQTIYKSRMADYTTKRSLIDELKGRARSLSAERLISRPDDSMVVSRLYKLFELYPGAITPTTKVGIKIGFTGTHILITPNKAPVDPATIIQGLKTELQPDLSYRVIVEAPVNEQGSALALGNKQ